MEAITNPTPEVENFNNLCELFSTVTPDGKTLVMCRTDPEKFIKNLDQAIFVWVEKSDNQKLKTGKYLFAGFYGEKNTPIYRAEQPVYKTT